MSYVNSIKVVSSVSGAAGGKSKVSENVIGGIASITSLTVDDFGIIGGDVDIGGNVDINGYLNVNNDVNIQYELNVLGDSYFTGISSFNNNVFVGGNLTVNGDIFLTDDLSFDEFVARNGTITGILTVSEQFYYGQYYENGIPYFNSTGLLVSTQTPENGIDYSNSILTTDGDGIPVWTNCIDGGEY